MAFVAYALAYWLSRVDWIQLMTYKIGLHLDCADLPWNQKRQPSELEDLSLVPLSVWRAEMTHGVLASQLCCDACFQ